MAAKKAKYPKEIFVKWEQYGRDDPYLVAHESAAAASDGANTTVEVAEYHLVRVRKVVTRVEVK